MFVNDQCIHYTIKTNYHASKVHHLQDTCTA